MKFSKYQGLGNDFLVVDLRGQSPSLHPELEDERGFFVAMALCDRRRGVGGDGVLTLSPPTSPNASATMRVLNADGSEAEMCGNGLRCVAKHLLETAQNPQTQITIDTGAGPLQCTATWSDQRVVLVNIDMGPARLKRSEIPMTGDPDALCLAQEYQIGKRRLSVNAVSMGNPHAITFVPESGEALRSLAIALGPILETHSDFPKRTNVEFAQVHSATEIELLVWERGVGITQACGTGACATVVAACRIGHCETESDVRVRLLGGNLQISVSNDYQSVHMSGPAEWVFEGSIDLGVLCGGVLCGGLK